MPEDKIITLPDLAREIAEIKDQLYILTQTTTSNPFEEEELTEKWEEYDENVEEDIDMTHYNFLKNSISFLEGRIKQLEEEKKQLIARNEVLEFHYKLDFKNKEKIEKLLDELRVRSQQMGIAMFRYGAMPANILDNRVDKAIQRENEINDLIKQIKELLFF